MVQKKPTKSISKRTTVKKRPQADDTDWKAKYDDLSDKVKKANAAKKAALLVIADKVNTLRGIGCDPDPPGCNKGTFTGTLQELINLVSEANAKKRALASDVQSLIKDLLKIMCDPDPPGCGT